MPVEDFTGQEIDIGALVEVEVSGEAEWYLLLNCGGGTEVTADGSTVTVITPESPLGKALMGNYNHFLTIQELIDLVAYLYGPRSR